MNSQPESATATLVILDDCLQSFFANYIGTSSYFRGTVEAYIFKFEEARDLANHSTPAQFLSYMSEIFSAPVVQEWATFLDKELDWHNTDGGPAVSDLMVYSLGAQARYTLSRVFQQFGEPELIGDCFYEHKDGQYVCANCASEKPLWADPLPRISIPVLDCLAVPASELEWFEEANHRVNRAIASSLSAAPPSTDLPQLRTADNRLFVAPESRDDDTVYLYYASRESRFTHRTAGKFPISLKFSPLSPSMSTFYCTTSPVAGLRHLKANRPKLLFPSSPAAMNDDPAALLVFKVSLGQLLGRRNIGSEGGERFKVKNWVENPNDELLFDTVEDNWRLEGHVWPEVSIDDPDIIIARTIHPGARHVGYSYFYNPDPSTECLQVCIASRRARKWVEEKAVALAVEREGAVLVRECE